MFINMCPTTKCKTPYCFGKCVPQIQSQIQSKLGSTSFLLNIITANGAIFSISIQFCAFGQVVSSKKDKSERISVNNEDTYASYKDRG